MLVDVLDVDQLFLRMAWTIAAQCRPAIVFASCVCGPILYCGMANPPLGGQRESAACWRRVVLSGYTTLGERSDSVGQDLALPLTVGWKRAASFSVLV